MTHVWLRVQSLVAAAGRRRRLAIEQTPCVAVPLVVLVALGHPTSAVIAAQGGVAGFYAFDAPLARRGRIVAAVGAGLVLATVLGTLVAESAPLVAVVGGAFATAAAFVCVALEMGPPREYFLVFSYLIATGLPPDAGAAPERGALVLAGAATALVIAMASGRRDPERPAREAVDAAHAAVARLVAAIGHEHTSDAGHAAVLAVRRALMTAPRNGALRRRAEGAETLLEAAQSLVVRSAPPVDPAWVEAVRAPEHAPETLPPPPLDRRLEGALNAARHHRTAPAEPVPERRWTEALRVGRQRQSPAPIAALRVGVAVAGGCALGAAVGGGHPYWIALSAAAVLQSTNAGMTLRRALHRTVGTFVGLLGAAAILAPDPPVGVLVAAVVVLQFLTASVIAASYGVAVVFITSLALVQLEIAHPSFGADVAGARAVDTLLGCALGLAVGVVFGPRGSLKRLTAAQAATLRAAGAALAAGLRQAPVGELRALRREANVSALNLRALQSDAIGDVLRRSPEADARWPLTHAIELLVAAATALPRRDPQPALADAVERSVEAFARTTEGVPTDVPSPALPGLPATERAMKRVRDALARDPRILGL